MLPLGPQLVQRPRKCDRLANVWDAADPRDRTLDAEPETRVHERPVLPEIQVPAVRLLGQLVLADAREQLVVVVLALAAGDDLAVALRRQHVVVEHGAGVGGVFLHIEGLYGLGIIVDQHGTVVLLGEQSLGVPAQVATPRDVAPQAFELFHGVGVGNPGKRRPHALERGRVALQLGQLGALALERPRDEVADEFLLQLHIVVGVVPGDFGLDHPELGEVPARLGLLGAERGPETVHLAVRRRGGLDVQLARLRQVRRAQVEVLGREQVPRGFADRAGEDWRVHQHEVALVEKVADRLNHFVAYPGDRHLAAAAQPQVPVLEQEGGAVLFWRDWEVVARPEDLQVGGRELDAAGCAPVGAHHARHLDGRLLREPAERLPGGGRAVRGSPALGETVIVVGVADRVVTLVDRATGQALWRARLAGTIHAGPLLDSDRIYVATEATPDARVYALRLRDGGTLWSTKTESIVAPLALDGDTLYAATEAGTVLRLETDGGKVTWRRRLGGGGARAAPIPTGGGIVVATTADTLYLLARDSGQVRTRVHTPGAVIAAPALDGSRLYAATTGGRILAIDLPALTVAWDLPAGDAVFGAPAVAHDTVYVLARNGTLWLAPTRRPSEARSFPLGITAPAGPAPVPPGGPVASGFGGGVVVGPRCRRVLWGPALD